MTETRDYLPNSNRAFEEKSLLNQALSILDAVGIPIVQLTHRQRERTAVCFVALAGIQKNWSESTSITEESFLRTRDIISIVNSRFNEQISAGTYDNIRRVTLKPLTLAGLVINNGDLGGFATNAPNRGYALNPEFRVLISSFGLPEWESKLSTFRSRHQSLSEQIKRNRDLQTMAVNLPEGESIHLGPGKHNTLQKAIIEEFLPRFGYSCSVLYVGDTSHKTLVLNQNALRDLGLFEINHEKLPDIIAYSPSKNWLFLIEAVHSSGPLSEMRLMELKSRLSACKAGLVFVTAFLTKADFKKWASDIAWETEVWVADAPDHLIHFNGGRFLGPY